MAARVNSRFVVILSVVLTVAFAGVAVVGVMMIHRTSAQLRALGDRQVAAGNYEKAADLYSRAVNKDQNNAELIQLWVDAIEHIRPTQPQAYREGYQRNLVPALRSLAEVRKTDVDAHRRFLDECYIPAARFGAKIEQWDDLIKFAEHAAANFPPDSTQAKLMLRYRALGSVGRWARQNTPPGREALEQARKDFRGALEADPADGEAAAAWASMEWQQANTARQLGDQIAADTLLAGARAVANDFLKDHPGSPQVLFQLLRLETFEAARQARAAAQPFTDPLYGQSALADRVFSAMQAAPAKDLDPVLVVNAMTFGASLGRDRALAVIDHALEGRPDDPFLLLGRADFQARGGDVDGAVATLQRVIDLKDKPLSLDGLLLQTVFRNQAATKQVEYVLGQWRPTMPVSERRAVLERAKGLRKALAERVGEDRPEVILADARIKFCEQDLAGARIVLTPYFEGEGKNDKAAQLLMGQIMTSAGSAGEAQRCFQRVVELDPNNVQARIMLATFAIRARDLARAEDHLAVVTQLDPSNKEAAAAREMLRGDSGDPVLRAMGQASRKIGGETADRQGAMDILRAALKNAPADARLIAMIVQLQLLGGEGPAALQTVQGALAAAPGDKRLVITMAQTQVALKDREGAIKTIDAALASAPQDAQLLELRRQLGFAEPIEFQIDNVDRMETLSDLDKHLLKFNIYVNASLADKAFAELDLAQAIDPSNPQVQEFTFNRAVFEGKIDQARQIAEKAAAANADNVGGQYFRGRLAMAERRYADAASAFQQATDQDPLNPTMWRCLGDARLGGQLFDQAAAAYDHALEIRPNDAPSLRGSVESTYRAGRADQALATARRALTLGVSDEQLVDMWLTLEASAPSGDKAKALEARQKLLKRKPDDRTNKLNIASLMIELKQFDAARALLDELRAAKLDDSVVGLDAHWHATKGDLDGARKVYADYIATLPEPHNEQPYLRLADVLLRAGKPDEAIRALQDGAKHQNPAVRQADRALGLVYLQTGNYQEAMRTFRQILEACKDDQQNSLLKAIVECQLQLKQFAEAESTLGALGEAAGKDQALVFFMARAAAGRKDLARARQLYDRAVQLQSDSPVGYFARAEYIVGNEPDRTADAERDLTNALRIDPRFRPARDALYQIYRSSQRWDDALGQLRQALTVEPENDEVRRRLVGDMLAHGQAKGACTMIDEAIRRHPDDIGWAIIAGQVFTAAGTPCPAVPYLAHAWSLAKSAQVALSYADLLTRCDPPDLQTARAVVSDPALSPEKSFPLLLMRARIFAIAKQPRDAEVDVTSAFRLVDQGNSDQAGTFVQGIGAVFESLKDQLAILAKLEAGAPFKDWFQFQACNLRLVDPASRPQALDVLRSIAGRADSPTLAAAAAGMLGNVAMQDRQFAEAEAQFRRCVELAPESAETNNNLAFVLASQANKCEEALPYAEKAVRLMPTETSMLDTLGVVYTCVGRLADAESTLLRARDAATNPGLQAPVFQHLTELYLRQGNRAKALQYLDYLDTLIQKAPALKDSDPDRARTDLRKKLESQ